MTINDLKCFLATAQTLNFTKAAELLYTTQPVVTRHIHLLEEELGFKLFDRSIRRFVQLTEAGEKLYAFLSEKNKEWNALLTDCRDAEQSRPIVFCLPEECMVPPAMHQHFDQFQRENPKAFPSFRYVNYQEMDSQLDDGHIVICQKDIAFTKKKYFYQTIETYSSEVCLFLSNKHESLKEGQCFDFSNLLGAPLFLPKNLPQETIASRIAFATKLIGAQPPLLLLDNIDIVVLYLNSRRGFTIATDWFKYHASSDLLSIPTGQKIHYAFFWSSKQTLTPVLQHFIASFKNTEIPIS